MPKIKIKKVELLHDGSFLRLIRNRYIGTSGKPGVWEMVDRKRHRGRVVAIAPLTSKKEIILTKIYRIPQKCYVVELCAGLQDKGKESEEATARRELLEETGYSVEKVEKIVAGPWESAITADEMVIFLGTNARRAQKQKPENSEDIKVLKIPLAKLEYFLLHPPRGVKVDLKIFGVLYFLKKRGFEL